MENLDPPSWGGSLSRTNKNKRLWLLIDWFNNLNIENYSLKNKELLSNLNIERKETPLGGVS
jgi:hypothetical protein